MLVFRYCGDMPHSEPSNHDIVQLLTAIKMNGFVRLPADHPVLSQLLDSRIVVFRPYYEKEDDQNAFLRAINSKKTEIVEALTRNDFPAIMQLSMSIQQLSTAINDHVWAANVPDEHLDQWIAMFTKVQAA